MSSQPAGVVNDPAGRSNVLAGSVIDVPADPRGVQDLMKIGHAGAPLGVRPGLTQRRQKQRGQARDDRDDDRQLDQGERLSLYWSRPNLHAPIRPAVPWDELAAKTRWTGARLKKAQAVRGRLNVPRERFGQTATGEFVWAGEKG